MVGKRKHGSIWVGLLIVLTAFVGTQASVAAGGQPPVISTGGPYEGYECNSFLFDASGSYDPEGAALQYRWNFDGSWTDWSSYPYGEYMWLDDFSGSIMLEVSDGDLISQASIDVIVSNVAPFILSVDSPAAAIEAGASMVVGLHYFDGDMRDTIPSLDTCTAVFSWGDGTSTTYTMEAGVTFVNASHVYANEGSYDIAVVLTDDDGGSSQTSLQIVVNPSSVPPETPRETPPQTSPRELIQKILDLKLSKGLLTSLLAKLGNIDPTKIHVELNRLGAFINFVEAQRGKQLTRAQGDALIGYARGLLTSLRNR
jgi:hypothetical protein